LALDTICETLPIHSRKKLKVTVSRDPEYSMTANIETIAKAGPAFSIQHPDVSLHTPVTLSPEGESLPVMPSDANS